MVVWSQPSASLDVGHGRRERPVALDAERDLSEKVHCLDVYVPAIDSRGVRAVAHVKGTILEHLLEVDVLRPSQRNAVRVAFGANDLAHRGDGLELDVYLLVLDRIIVRDIPVLTDIRVEGALPVAYGKVGDTRISQTYARPSFTKLYAYVSGIALSVSCTSLDYPRSSGLILGPLHHLGPYALQRRIGYKSNLVFHTEYRRGTEFAHCCHFLV